MRTRTYTHISEKTCTAVPLSIFPLGAIGYAVQEAVRVCTTLYRCTVFASWAKIVSQGRRPFTASLFVSSPGCMQGADRKAGPRFARSAVHLRACGAAAEGISQLGFR